MPKLLLALALILYVFTPAHSAEFSLNEKKDVITLEGDIIYGDALNFITLLIENPEVKQVRLTSDGGMAMEAFEIGIQIYDRKIETIAVGNCYSACAFVWLAGSTRYIEYGAEVAIHAVYDASKENKVTNETSLMSGFYLGRIRIEYGLAIFINFIPANRLWALNEVNLRRYGVEAIHLPAKTERTGK